MLVFVRRLRGAPVSLDVALSLTVAEFKALIHIQTGVAPAAAKLIYAGRVLQDKEALSAYNLQKECSVQLFETILQVAAPPPAEDADGSNPSNSSSGAGSNTSDSVSASSASSASASSPPAAPASMRAPKSLAGVKKQQSAASGKAASSSNISSSAGAEDASPAARAWAASPVWSNDMILVQLVEAKDLLTTDFLSRTFVSFSPVKYLHFHYLLNVDSTTFSELVYFPPPISFFARLFILCTHHTPHPRHLSHPYYICTTGRSVRPVRAAVAWRSERALAHRHQHVQPDL
jgi:hypothetical protein